MEHLEAALSSARANHLPCRNVFGKALQGDGPEIAILEHASGQFACARRNDHRARFGGRLEASGKIGRLSDHRLLLRGSRTEEVTDHDEPSGDSDTRLQGDIGSGFEL